MYVQQYNSTTVQVEIRSTAYSVLTVPTYLTYQYQVAISNPGLVCADSRRRTTEPGTSSPSSLPYLSPLIRLSVISSPNIVGGLGTTPRSLPQAVPHVTVSLV
jgi:hypothetical protein